MTRPRIIMADEDFNYIIPLQHKFAEEFFNKIDLEVITDRNYFLHLFSTPQQADVLIISEKLYDASLQKHNINHIFLMMEQYEENVTASLNINRLFKYTSIKEIFNEITGKSAGVFQLDRDVKKNTQIIVVYSACGGVGKTTVAMGISASLTQNYKNVLYINADRLQTFQQRLKNQSAITETDVYVKLTTGRENIYQEIKHVIRKEIFAYLPPFKASLMALNLSYDIFEKIAVSAKKTNDYDYIVIDADTAFDEEKARLLNIADRIVIVTEQTKASVFATNMLVSNINGTNSDKYIFICNNFDKYDDNALIAPNVKKRFTVNDYIERFRNYDQMNCEDFAKEKGIQKMTFLIV
ncbi:MAG: AAA family ATPase [Lachnospiraceae bacterium]|nr:AAA family ATPase [Lachnospiraceae bacterium]